MKSAPTSVPAATPLPSSGGNLGKIESAHSPRASNPAVNGNFKEVLESLIRDDPFREISNIQQKMVKGARFSPQELLYYQIRAGEMGVRIEAFSKLAEGVLGALKRIQSQT